MNSNSNSSRSRNRSRNPFPGPQPYRAADRARFFGRDEMAWKLGSSILAHPCVTVFGPSGAGKSSLMQAAVMPSLEAEHDVRAVRVDTWPEDKTATAWLAAAMFDELSLDAEPEGTAPEGAVIAAAQRAARRSDRPILIYLDQIEQLLFPSRDPVEAEALFECVEALVSQPLRELRVVLSLREDYLGRLRDRLRGRWKLLDHGFRVGPLSVGELSEAVCQAAAAGDPPQAWDHRKMLALMLQVRVPGQAETAAAEAQAAYAQIVCRALWAQRTAEGAGGPASQSSSSDPIAAAPIVERYLDETLKELGPQRESAARRLLEDHLIVAANGSRTLRTEAELFDALGGEELGEILIQLEAAAILRAEEHQGTRYFELGHDWLARKVFERRQERELAEAERERDEEQRRKDKEQRRELALQRAEQQRLRRIALASVMAAVLMAFLGFWALQERAEAQLQHEKAEARKRDAENEKKKAAEQAARAQDASLMAGARELLGRSQPMEAAALLVEVKDPEWVRGWIGLAYNCLAGPLPKWTLQGHRSGVSSAAWSGDGKRIVTASADETARIWSADGSGKPLVLKGHTGIVYAAAWSPDNKRIVTTSADMTARIWSADGSGEPVVLEGHTGSLYGAAWSPDGTRIVTASLDTTARIWSADGSGEPVVLKGHTGIVYAAAWSPDGKRVVTASGDSTARVWSADGSGKFVVLKGHEYAVISAAWSPDGKRVATGSWDNLARIWSADGRGKPLVLKGHDGDVRSVAWSPDGKRIVTASTDASARVWSAASGDQQLILQGHLAMVSSAEWSPDGEHILTASDDKTARVWSADGSDAPVILRGHANEVRTAVWSAHGKRVLTASDDATARVWSIDAGRTPVILHSHAGGISSVAWSADGERVLTTSMNGASGHTNTRVWSADGSGEPEVPKGFEKASTSPSLSPDGKRVLTILRDKTARVASADGSGEPVILKGHEKAITSAAWSPDGERVLTTSVDKTARVWTIHDGGDELIVLKGHTAAVSTAAWSPDGKRVVTGSLDQTARVWVLSIPTLQQALRDATTECLSTDLRWTYLDDTEAEARKRYEACERAAGRVPFDPNATAP